MNKKIITTLRIIRVAYLAYLIITIYKKKKKLESYFEARKSKSFVNAENNLTEAALHLAHDLKSKLDAAQVEINNLRQQLSDKEEGKVI